MGLSASTPIDPEKMAAIQQKVEEIIANNKVAVFSKSYCRKYPMRALIYTCSDITDPKSLHNSPPLAISLLPSRKGDS
jgi:hypothetical protein